MKKLLLIDLGDVRGELNEPLGIECISSRVIREGNIKVDICWYSMIEANSFENLLLPYLNGTHPMPDLFIFDHGHNDVRPRGVDGKQDSLVLPTASHIASGVLAEDTYMTANNYANLKKYN